ncbi:hypothetical protein [Filifactor alocis]
MSKTVNRKNNCTVHFMVNEGDINEFNRRFVLTNFKNKREFYRDSIFKNRIISINISGEFRK